MKLMHSSQKSSPHIHRLQSESIPFEVLSTTFFLVWTKPGKIFFISLQKLFSFSRKAKFIILDIQISWRHQMLKYKTKNAFY